MHRRFLRVSGGRQSPNLGDRLSPKANRPALETQGRRFTILSTCAVIREDPNGIGLA